MNLPRTVIIKDVKYKITCKKQGEYGEVDGLCFFDTKTIYIDPTLELDEKKRALFHEITHAVFHEYKIKPRKDNTRHYEDTVSKLEGFVQVLEDNPKIADYIRRNND